MDAKATVWHYLKDAREQVLWKVEGLSERDQRMPLTPTGTNLLGVVKHLAGVEAEYFGMCLGRPWPEPMAFWADDAEPNDDMFATAEESPAQILDLYRRVTAFADEGIAPLPLDTPAHVPWWQEQDTTLYHLLVHMGFETARHAGHLDILREQSTVDADGRPRTRTCPRAGTTGGAPTYSGCATSPRPAEQGPPTAPRADSARYRLVVVAIAATTRR